MRTEKTIKNAVASIIMQAIGLIINFIARIFFIRCLGEKYLGLNGLYTNILQVLSIAELGIGEAINYSLYRPLSENDTEKCGQLMDLYKKIYLSIGLFIALTSSLLIPFLPQIIGDVTGIENYVIIYLLFIANTSVSYLYSYNWNILVADQNKYVVNITRYSIYSLFKIIQIVYLAIEKDMVGYMVLQVTSTFFENYILSKIAKRKYRYIEKKNDKKLEGEEKQSIINSIKAMMTLKIGNTLITSTDNIIISQTVGLIAVGEYSNYYMIVNSVNLILNQMFSSITATVGNMHTENNRKKEIYLFNCTQFISYVIYSTLSIVIYITINDIVAIWAGDEYVLSRLFALIIAVLFYENGMRKPVQLFKEACGLFRIDRWRTLIEASLNIIISIYLGLTYGLPGVLMGTIMSALLVSFWYEPYVLYKYSFREKLNNYYARYAKYTTATIISATISHIICCQIQLNGLPGLAIKILAIIFIEIFVTYLFFRKSKELQYVKTIAKRKGKQ